jgi:hypothetical protein
MDSQITFPSKNIRAAVDQHEGLIYFAQRVVGLDRKLFIFRASYPSLMKVYALTWWIPADHRLDQLQYLEFPLAILLVS